MQKEFVRVSPGRPAMGLDSWEGDKPPVVGAHQPDLVWPRAKLKKKR